MCYRWMFRLFFCCRGDSNEPAGHIYPSIAIRYSPKSQVCIKTVSCFRGLVGQPLWQCFSEDILVDSRYKDYLRDTCLHKGWRRSYLEMHFIPVTAILWWETEEEQVTVWLLPSSGEWASGVFFWNFVTPTSWGLHGKWLRWCVCSALLCFADYPIDSR